MTSIDYNKKRAGTEKKNYESLIEMINDRNRYIKDAYDRIFSDKALRKEQRLSARWFEGLETKDGQEW